MALQVAEGGREVGKRPQELKQEEAYPTTCFSSVLTLTLTAEECGRTRFFLPHASSVLPLTLTEDASPTTDPH